MISWKPCVCKLYVFVKSTYLILNCVVTKIQRINFEGHKGMEGEANRLLSHSILIIYIFKNINIKLSYFSK
ncbi:hypothetical protein JHK82_033091 [Glycine max]|nr:hypothetical protein JHK82_033091 [Glycine max]